MNIATEFRKACDVAVEEPRRAPRPFQERELIDKSIVAELSMTAIDRMTCEELVRVIRTAELENLSCDDLNRRLPFYDRATLVRLAHLARRCCQNQGY